MTAAKFEFEGTMMTAREIRALVPAISDAAIREHLKAGRNTRQAMLTHRQRRTRPKQHAKISYRRKP